MKRASIRRPVLMRLLYLLAAAAMTAAFPAAAGETTFTRTINDLNHDNLLEFATGEHYLVRTDLHAAVPGRAGRRQVRVSFAQFTDTHIVDEETPLRVEFLDRLGPPVNGAYRAHEGLSPQVMNEMV